MYETNLLEFVSKEENNLLTTLVNYHADIGQFSKVDGHFQAPTKHVAVPAADTYGRTILGLYLFTHYHLYLSFVTLIRCHLSDSLASTRKALDATLTAYRLHAEPNTLDEYLNERGTYKFIARTISRAREKDANLFPLAPSLLHLHGVCSQFGSHADISSFVHRIKVVPLDAGKGVVEHLMFQYPKDPEEFRYYLVSTMSAYILMLQVFIDSVAKYTKDFDIDAWAASKNALIASTEKVRAALAAVGRAKKEAEKSE